MKANANRPIYQNSFDDHSVSLHTHTQKKKTDLNMFGQVFNPIHILKIGCKGCMKCRTKVYKIKECFSQKHRKQGKKKAINFHFSDILSFQKTSILKKPENSRKFYSPRKRVGSKETWA